MKVFEKEAKLKGLHMSDIANQLGISNTAIYAWLTGMAHPSPKNVTKLKGMGFSDQACLEPSKEVEI